MTKRAPGREEGGGSPISTGLSTEMVPPARSTISRLMERPRPVPTSGPLVVKNGCQMRAMFSAGTPTPVSTTSISTVWPSLRVETVTWWSPS